MALKFRKWARDVMKPYRRDPDIRWDVSLTGAAHAKLTIYVGEQSRFVIFPASPSDGRGKKNFRAQVRRTIAELRGD